MRTPWGLVLALLVATAGCDKDTPPHVMASMAPFGAAEPAAAGGGRARRPIAAQDFDLERTAALIRFGKVKDGPQLQQALEREGLGKVDVDADGQRDRLQVVETRDGEDRTLTVRAVPSSHRGRDVDAVAVPIAVIVVEPDGQEAHVTVRFVAGVVDAPAPIVWETPVVAASFCHWLLVVERPVFVGTIVVVVTPEVRVHRGKHKHKHKHKKWKH